MQPWLQDTLTPLPVSHIPSRELYHIHICKALPFNAGNQIAKITFNASLLPQIVFGFWSIYTVYVDSVCILFARHCILASTR